MNGMEARNELRSADHSDQSASRQVAAADARASSTSVRRAHSGQRQVEDEDDPEVQAKMASGELIAVREEGRPVTIHVHPSQLQVP